jgi:hypothetical protein
MQETLAAALLMKADLTELIVQLERRRGPQWSLSERGVVLGHGRTLTPLGPHAQTST